MCLRKLFTELKSLLIRKFHELSKEHWVYCQGYNLQTRGNLRKWYFVTKIVLTYCKKNYSSDRENFLKFEAEGREFAKVLRSLEQFVQIVKGQNNFL